jgi:hypothetical protein
LWTYYYPNGQQSAVEQFFKWVLNGEVIYYYPTGKLQGKEQLANRSLWLIPPFITIPPASYIAKENMSIANTQASGFIFLRMEKWSV